jgi:hypothetical protein
MTATGLVLAKTQHSADFIFRLRTGGGRVAKKFYQPVSSGFSRALVEEFSGSFHDSKLFRNRSRNPRVQGHPASLASRCAAFFTGMRKLPWIRRSAHGFTHAMISLLHEGQGANLSVARRWGNARKSFFPPCFVKSPSNAARGR